jgi:radical SAM superfamily enzyme YgiQ (UPF0313 family)
VQARALIIPHTSVIAERLVGIFPTSAYCLKEACASLPCRVDVLNPYLALSDLICDSVETIGDAIIALFDPGAYDVVGISTMGLTFPLSVYIAQSIKRYSPETRVVFGGPHVSFVAHQVLEQLPYVDAIVVGEGEETFVSMMQRFDVTMKAWREIPGVVLRDSLFIPAPLVPDLDTLPIIDYSDIRRQYLNSSNNIQNEIEGVRGCHASCSFCSTTNFWRRKVRRKSAARLVDEMLQLAESTQHDQFHILGDNFTSAIRFFREFCNLLVERNLGFRWSCSCRIGDLSTTDLDLMKRAGCTACFVGVESASQETILQIKKKMDLPQTLKTIEYAVNIGIDIRVSQIVGFPWETKGDLANTLKQHTRLLNMGVKDSIVNSLMPLAGAEGFHPARIIVDPETIKAELPGVYKNSFTLDLIAHHPDLFSSFGYYEASYIDRGYILAAVETAKNITSMMHGRG